LFPAINFAIYAVLVVRYVVPALREYLRRRSSDLAAATAEAHTALTAAEESHRAATARHGAIAGECETVRRDLEVLANRQAERLQADAEVTGKRRLADASLVADQERRRAFDSVRAEIATLATEIAESRIKGALSDGDQRAFVERFLKDAPSR
jgi:F0F1-type ATP synthase membrane subunit b/b'